MAISTNSILIGADMTNYIVTGFHTPDEKYTALANKLRQNLDALGIPHRIYARNFDGGWDRQLMAKPSTVLLAMRENPGKTIVLMDIDCEVTGKLAELVDTKADVDLNFSVKAKRRNKSSMWASSRIVVWHPTPNARRLAMTWLEFCEKAVAARSSRDILCDERQLMAAIHATPGVCIAQVDERFAALEVGTAPEDAVIVHQSAHNASKKLWGIKSTIKTHKRALIERLTGKPYAEWKHGA